MVTLIIHRQHGELGQLIAQFGALHMEIGPDDRFDPGTVRAAIKLHQPAEVGEIRDCQGRHSEGSGSLNQRAHFG